MNDDLLFFYAEFVAARDAGNGVETLKRLLTEHPECEGGLWCLHLSDASERLALEMAEELAFDALEWPRALARKLATEGWTP